MTQLEYFINRIIVNSEIQTFEDFIERHNLREKNRKPDVVLLRQYVAYKIRRSKSNQYTLTEIAQMLGLKDHSIIIHAIKAIENDLKVRYKPLRELKDKYESELNKCT